MPGADGGGVGLPARPGDHHRAQGEQAARAAHPQTAPGRPLHLQLDYTSNSTYLDEVLDEERGWCELSIPAMSMMVFRHRMLTDFSIEPFEFVAQARRRKNAPAEEAP